jgi:hypothetical protein
MIMKLIASVLKRNAYLFPKCPGQEESGCNFIPLLCRADEGFIVPHPNTELPSAIILILPTPSPLSPARRRSLASGNRAEIRGTSCDLSGHGREITKTLVFERDSTGCPLG